MMTTRCSKTLPGKLIVLVTWGLEDVIINLTGIIPQTLVEYFQKVELKRMISAIQELLCWIYASYRMGNGGAFFGVQRPGCADDYSPPFGTEVKNACSCTSAHLIRFHGVIFC